MAAHRQERSTQKRKRNRLKISRLRFLCLIPYKSRTFKEVTRERGEDLGCRMRSSVRFVACETRDSI